MSCGSVRSLHIRVRHQERVEDSPGSSGDQPDSGGPAQLSAPSLRSPRFSRTLTDSDLSPGADSAMSVREQRSHDHQLVFP